MVCILSASVGRYTENTEYRGIEINTASFLQISKYRDRNLIGKFVVIFIVKMTIPDI